jgi:DNA-binding CsgD family transcriptional regulator
MQIRMKARFGPRERQVLSIMLRGLGEKEIARELGISPNTVHSYVTNIYRYFGVDSRAALLSLWIKDGPSATLEPPRTWLGDESVLTAAAATVGC